MCASTISSAEKSVSCKTPDHHYWYPLCLLPLGSWFSIINENEELRERYLPVKRVPAEPLISSSSSGAIKPFRSQCEPSNDDVYDGTAVPDLCSHAW